MIPYEQLCAALDRYNGKASADQTADQPLEDISTGDLVEVSDADVEAAVVDSFPAEPTPAAPEEVAEEEAPVYSSGGEDAAAASGFIGGDTDEASDHDLPAEAPLQVEPEYSATDDALRIDETDEVRLEEVEVVGEDPAGKPEDQ